MCLPPLCSAFVEDNSARIAINEVQLALKRKAEMARSPSPKRPKHEPLSPELFTPSPKEEPLSSSPSETPPAFSFSQPSPVTISRSVRGTAQLSRSVSFDMGSRGGGAAHDQNGIRLNEDAISIKRCADKVQEVGKKEEYYLDSALKFLESLLYRDVSTFAPILLPTLT